MKQEGQKVEREDTLVFVLVKYANTQTQIQKTEDGQSRWWIDESPASESNFPPILYFLKRKKVKFIFKEGGYN